MVRGILAQETPVIADPAVLQRIANMKAVRDPEGVEVKTLLAACPLKGKHVLEIGCGSGKLGWWR